MPLAIDVKRPRLRWKHLYLSSRDHYIYSELDDSDHDNLIPSIVTDTTYIGKTAYGTPTPPCENTLASTSTSTTPSSRSPPWKLLRLPSLILLDESEQESNNEDDPDSNRSTRTVIARSSPSNTRTLTSNSFLPESLAETKALDQMFRLLERLDGRRSRNSSLGSSSSSSKSRNNNSRNNNHKKNSNNNDDDDDDGRHSLLPKVSLSQSYDTADTELEEEEYTDTLTTTTNMEGGDQRRTNLLWFGPENTQTFSAAASAILQRKKGVTWADDDQVRTTGGGSGNNDSSDSDKRLVTRYHYTPLPEQYHRVVILLLHPVELKFEFLHAEYDTDIRLTVRQVLQQLSSMAVNPGLKELEWGALCLRDTQREMINCMTLQEYNIYDGSMLIAVPMDYAPKIVLEQAGFFLTDKVLRRVVKRAKIKGQSPQRLQAHSAESTKSCNGSDTSDTSDTDDEDDDNSALELPSADPASVPSSLSFDASVVVKVPSIQDDDFDDFWGRVDEDDINFHATNTPTGTAVATATTGKSRRLADHVPTAFERFFAAGDVEDRDPFGFNEDLVRLAPLPTNPVVEVQVEPSETVTTPSSSSSSSEPAVVSTLERGHPDSSTTTATDNATTSQVSTSASAGGFTETKATNETIATNEDLSACSPEQEEDASTSASV
jgi:hypothetical protein